MGLFKMIMVAVLLAAPPGQAALGMLCQDSERHQVDHCSAPAQSSSSLVRAPVDAPAGCLDMPFCGEPGPSLLALVAGQMTAPDPSDTLLPTVDAMHSIAGPRPATPPPNV